MNRVRALSALLLGLAACAVTCGGVFGTIVTGGPGGALWFERERADVLGISWRTQPLRAATVEFWVYITDRMNADHAVLGFSEFSGTGPFVVDNPDSLQIRLSATRSRFYRGDALTCSTCRFFPLGWSHFAGTWDSSSGDVSLYINGLKSASFLGNGGFFRTNLTLGGSMLLGQEPDGYSSLFDEFQSFSGCLDEFRYWNYARSATEIATYWNVSIATLPANARNGLSLYYDFDDASETHPSGGGFLTDLSGNGNTGALGYLPNSRQWMTFATTKPEQVPTRPVAIHSGASSLVGRSPVSVYVNLLAGPATITATVTLRAFDGTGNGPLAFAVVNGPAVGTLFDIADGTTQLVDSALITDAASPNGATVRLIYSVAVAAANGAGGSTPGVTFATFTYNVTNGVGDVTTQSVHVKSRPLQPPPARTFKHRIVDTQHCVLGGVLSDNTIPIVVITTVPTYGSLYQAALSPTGSGLYTDLLSSGALLTSRPINASSPTVYTTDRGIVSYIAPANLFLGHPELIDATTGKITVTFDYAWQHPITGVVSASATVSLVISSTDIVPVATKASTTLSGEANGTISLGFTDFDIANSAAPFARITRWPKFGSLYQVNSDGSIGHLIESIPGPLPTVQSYAIKVDNVSSQVSACVGCAQLLSCPSTCSGFVNSAVQLVGPENCYPAYGDCAASYLPSTKTGGREYFELSFDTAMYIQQVQIFETLNPGTVTAVSSAPKWYGSYQTKWQRQWSGLVRTDIPATARIFAPPICRLPYASKALRVDFNTGNVKSGVFTAFDAVRIIGTLQLAIGQVSSSSLTVLYVPKPGVTSANTSAPFDSFDFRVSDCELESADTTYTIYRTEQTIIDPDTGRLSSSVPVWNTESVTIQANVVTTITVPVTLAAAEQGVSTSGAIVQVLGAGNALGEVKLFQINSDSTAGDGIDLSDGAAVALTDSQFRFGIQPTVDVAVVPVSVLITLNGYSYRYVLTANVDQTVALVIYKQDPSLEIGVDVVAALMLALTALVMVFLFVKRNEPVVRASSPFFCAAAVGGIALAYVLVFIWTPYAPTTATCVLSTWLGHIGFCLAYGSVFAKTSRINKILNMQKVSRVVMTDLQLFSRLVLFIGVMGIYLTVWSIVDTPRPFTNINAGTSSIVCTSTNSFWPNLPIAVEGLMMGYGAYLAYSARGHPSLFNESQHIAVAIYNTTVMGVIFVVLTKVVIGDQRQIKIFEVTGVLLCSTITLAALFGPMLKSVFFPTRSDLIDAGVMMEPTVDAPTSPGGGMGTQTNPNRFPSTNPNGNNNTRLQAPASQIVGGATPPTMAAVRAASSAAGPISDRSARASALDSTAPGYRPAVGLVPPTPPVRAASNGTGTGPSPRVGGGQLILNAAMATAGSMPGGNGLVSRTGGGGYPSQMDLPGNPTGVSNVSELRDLPSTDIIAPVRPPPPISVTSAFATPAGALSVSSPTVNTDSQPLLSLPTASGRGGSSGGTNGSPRNAFVAPQAAGN